MKMMYTRDKLLERLVDRLHTAAERCERHGDENGDILFDALAMTGFELQSFEPAYWHPLDAEMADLIKAIRFGCLEYENEKPDVSKVIDVHRLRVLSKYLIGRLEEMADYFEQIVEPTPPQISPIAILFNQTFKIQHTPSARNGKQKELEKERAIRHQQVKTHIIHIQMQTDVALRNLDKTITQLMEMYDEGRMP